MEHVGMTLTVVVYPNLTSLFSDSNLKFARVYQSNVWKSRKCTMSKIFQPNRSLGYVSNHIPLQVRYIKSRQENLVVTCVGKSFHTYGISHFGLLSVSGLHPEDITALGADTFHVYTACKCEIYAWRRGTELKRTYKGHTAPVHLLLPFGPHLVSIDIDSNVKVWDIKAENIFLELGFNNKTFQITTLLHPSTYINKILLGSDQGELQLWNLNTAKLIYTFKGWKSPVTCLEQAPALDVVAVGLANGRIILHNLKYDKTVVEFTQDWGAITAISFRTDGNPVMATGSLVGNIVFWDLEERRVLSQKLGAHDSAVTSLVCLPSEPLMLTSSPDNTLKLWIFDMPDGSARLLRLREGHSAPPNCIRFHGANGSNILSSASDSTLRIFNTQTEQFNKSLGKASYNRKASKKRGKLAEDPLMMPPIINFTSETTREKEWDNIAAIHQGLALVTTWSYDKLKMGTLKLIPERFCRKNKDPALNVTATCLHLSHCGNFVLIGYSTGHIDRFNIQSGIWRDSYGNPKAHETSVRGLAGDGLNQVVISGGSDCKINFWKFNNNGSKPLTVLDLSEPVNFMRSHQESSLLAVALEDFDIYIIDIDSRTAVRKFSGHTAQLTDATFSPDSRWLITASMDLSIRVWDIPSAQLVDQFATEMACVSLNMSPTGEALATAHVDNLGIYLWTNKTLYSKITLKAISPRVQPALIGLPECLTEYETVEEVEEEMETVEQEQLSRDLVTLSGLASSRWQNLLNIDVIKERNKPKLPPKKPKSAPFFLPTVSALDLQFDLSKAGTSSSDSKILTPLSLSNLTAFGKLLEKTAENDDFTEVIEKLKTLGPSMIDFEINSLTPENGGTVQIMLQFLKCLEFMLKSNRDFELAEAYLGVFLKAHVNVIAEEEVLRTCLNSIEEYHAQVWNRIQKKFFYSLCVVRMLKTM